MCPILSFCAIRTARSIVITRLNIQGKVVRTKNWIAGRMLLLALLFGLAGCVKLSQDTGSISNEVQVFFSDPLFSEGQDETLLSNLIRFLDSAAMRLDIAVYGLGEAAVMRALERACDRDVNIRLVTEVSLLDEPLNHALKNLQCLSLKVRQGSANSLMHHKFAVADQRLVWTGSTNWTTSGLRLNANNAVALDSPPLAARYSQAFERLFGENLFGKPVMGLDPGPIQAGSSVVSVYFSPNVQLENEIIRLVQSAQSSIRLAMFYYTNDRLHKSLLDALSRGIRIQALWGQRSWRQCDSSEIDEMLSLGVGSIAPLRGILHHKFAIIDDQTVITGSANWTASAFKRNDEDVLVIKDRAVADRYKTEFDRLYRDAKQYGAPAGAKIRFIQRNYNAVPGTVRLEWHPFKRGQIEAYEICRALKSNGDCQTRFNDLPGDSWWFVDHAVRLSGTYFYRIRARIRGSWTPYSDEIRMRVSSNPTATRPAQFIETNFASLKGQIATVLLVPKDVIESRSGNVFIHAGENFKKDFTAFIPACAVERFKNIGIDFDSLASKELLVSGELQSFNGPEIILYDPGQLRLSGGAS